MSNYFDNSHIDGKQLTPQQIADAIRHKKFGVDVREAMAQGLEYCMAQAQKVDKLEQDLSNLDKRVTWLEVLPSEVAEIEQDIGTINKHIDKLEQDLSNLDKRVTALEVLPSEVAEVKRDIGTINKQIDKLNFAVFGDGATEVQTTIYSQENHSQLAKEVKLD